MVWKLAHAHGLCDRRPNIGCVPGKGTKWKQCPYQTSALYLMAFWVKSCSTEKANDIGKEHFGMKRKEYRKYKKEASCKKRNLIWENSVRC